MPSPNVRFWTWINNSPVKITLEPGQVLDYVSGGPTDEGYSYTCIVFEWDAVDNEVIMLTCHSGADCDGPHYSEYRQTARPQYLHANDSLEDGVAYPAWTTQSSRQRDYFAEAMGY